MSKKTIEQNHTSVKVEESASNNSGRQFYAEIRHGPLPDARELAEYKKIDKNIPGKIVAMAEREQRFRHLSTLFGQFQFAILVVAGYGLAAYAGINGAQWTGAVIAAGVSYVTYVFKSKNPSPPKIQTPNNLQEKR